MVSFGDFRCFTPTGDNICFFGGTCNTNNVTMRETCDCPDGYTHDYFTMHLDNCALPEGVYLALLIIQSFFATIFLPLLFVTFRGTKNAARAITFRYSVEVVLVWTASFGLYIQNGYFEIAIIFVFFALAWGVYGAFLHFKAVFLDPIFAISMQLSSTQKEQILYRQAVVPCVIFVILLVLASLLLWTCREENPRNFNLVLYADLWVQLFSWCSTKFISTPSEKILLNLLKEMAERTYSQTTGKENHVVEYEAKLKTATERRKRGAFVFFFTSLPFVIVFSIMGSIPFMWIASLIRLLVLWVIITVHLLFIPDSILKTRNRESADWRKTIKVSQHKSRDYNLSHPHSQSAT